MIVYNTSNRTVTLKDTGGTLYNIGAYSSLFVSDTKLTDNEFRRWLRWRDRDIIVDLSTTAPPNPSVGTQGMKRETFSRTMIQGATAPTAGVINGTACSLFAGDVISSIGLGVSANGTSITLFKVAIYDKNGVQLAASADVDSTFNAGTTPRVQVTALGSPYTVTTSDLYYLSFLSVGGTPPTLIRGVSLAAADAQYSSGAFPYMISTGSQTDLLTSFTPLTATNAYWMGAS